MNSTQIEKVLIRRCRGQFLGVFAKDTMPRVLPAQRPILLVCNTDVKSQPGEHWIAIYIGKTHRGEFFDSFGRPPEPTFAQFLARNCVGWRHNNRQIQSSVSYFCGQYCCFYCLYKSIDTDLLAITGCFSNDTGLNDYMVHAFICKLLNV